MDSPFIIPLGFFAMVALIVALFEMTRIHDREVDTARTLQLEEAEHRRAIRELDDELTRVKTY